MRHRFLTGAVIASSLIQLTVAAASGEDSGTFENRCGWFENPSPGNAWLTDRDGAWYLGVQGGHQATGDWPLVVPTEWIETNVHYGYGCACIRARFDPATRNVLVIQSATGKRLRDCRRDRMLTEPESAKDGQ